MKTSRIALIAGLAVLALLAAGAWRYRARSTSSPQDCLRGTARVADALAARLGPGGTLFVYAREVDRNQGPPTVVTSVKEPAYPQEFSLCPADQMIPGFAAKPLTGRYRVYARHSATGAPMVEEGFAGDTAGDDGAGIRAGQATDILIDRALDGPR